MIGSSLLVIDTHRLGEEETACQAWGTRGWDREGTLVHWMWGMSGEEQGSLWLGFLMHSQFQMSKQHMILNQFHEIRNHTTYSPFLRRGPCRVSGQCPKYSKSSVHSPLLDLQCVPVLSELQNLQATYSPPFASEMFFCQDFWNLDLWICGLVLGENLKWTPKQISRTSSYPVGAPKILIPHSL